MLRSTDRHRFDARNEALATSYSRRDVCKGLALALAASGLALAATSPTAAQEIAGTSGTMPAIAPGQGTEIDFDGDDLSDQQENYWGLNPSRADADGDGLGDGDEFYDRYARSDPSLDDTDFDGLRTDPFYSDTDWDGRRDGEEIFAYDSNPLHPDR